ncbi:MAG TPA: DUF4440 domain-containing protein [Bryobacteraceae bacterium]|jgi:uncharacterized protein (TIGR02246 family)|nr:DUF4440 domain-containing protein [Bryobacteraceae bacterium]
MRNLEEETTIPSKILALERAALDRWGKGDPGGCLELSAPDVTYFDPAVPRRIDGHDALRKYYAPFTGKISVDRFEFVNPHIRVNGDMAVLTYNLVDHLRSADGTESIGTRWNVTEVYEQSGGGWKIVHTHFSYTERP